MLDTSTLFQRASDLPNGETNGICATRGAWSRILLAISIASSLSALQDDLPGTQPFSKGGKHACSAVKLDGPGATWRALPGPDGITTEARLLLPGLGGPVQLTRESVRSCLRGRSIALVGDSVTR